MPDIILKGQTWNTVPAVEFMTPGSGTLTGATYYWTGDSDVTPQDVVQGKTFYNGSGKTIGSLSVSAEDIRYGSTITGVTGTFSGSNTIDDGGSGVTPIAATPGHILAGHAAFLDGQQITGNMPINEGYYTQITPGGSNQVTLQDGYYSNSIIAAAVGSYTIPIFPSTSMQTLTADGYYWTSVEVLPAQSIYDGASVDIATPSDVVQGKWFLSQNGLEEGTYTPSSSVTYTVTNATDGDVLSGKSFYKATSTTTATLIVGSYTPPTGGFNIDLTGTTWVFNNTISDLPSSQFTLSFEDGNDHSWFYITTDGGGSISYKDGKDDIVVYDTKTDWHSSNYQTITITGGTDASNPALVAWLLTNATKQ